MKRAPNQTDVLVGARARLRRVELGLSQTTLATRLGVTFQQVQKYERGTNRIGAGRLHILARALEVPVSYFFDSVPEMGDVPPSDALQLLAVPGALQLLKDYALLDAAVRKAAVIMIGTAARAGSAPAAEIDAKSH
jgi:transcriptional regulator with XRE-family HTH domain